MRLDLFLEYLQLRHPLVLLLDVYLLDQVLDPHKHMVKITPQLADLVMVISLKADGQIPGLRLFHQLLQLHGR